MSQTTFLDHILEKAREDLEAAKQKVSLNALKQRIKDAPPPRGFRKALASGGFRLIAEVKRRSPSIGELLAKNVAEAPAVYASSPLVACVSILTNERFFSTGLDDLARIRATLTKPVLRKDFLFDPYQIYEARAWGADAVLLMANVVDPSTMHTLSELASELGMDTLVEVHTREEIDSLPSGIDLCGINSRKFQTTQGFVASGESSKNDFSLDYSAFELVDALPKEALKVAESGIHPKNIAEISRHFHAALIGTSLLRAPQGVAACLHAFEEALNK